MYLSNLKGVAYLRCNTCKYYAGIENGQPYVNREHLDGVTLLGLNRLGNVSSIMSISWNLLAIIMVNHYFQVYSRHQGLNLVDEMANKSLVIVNGNVRNNID